MECTRCNRSLTDYVRSAEIPGMKNWHYVACKECGNVMRAEFVEGEINVLQSTASTSTPEVMKEIELAKELFAQSGSPVRQYTVDKSVDSPASEHKAIVSNREEGPDKVSNSPEPKKKSFIAKIRDFCKRLF